MYLLYLRCVDDMFMIWKGAKAELMTFIKELNAKQNYQISQRKIAFLETMLLTGKNNNIQTNLYQKPTDEQAFLHTKPEYVRSLKNSSPYSKA